MPDLTPHAVASLVFTIVVFALYTIRRVPIVVTSLLVLVALPLAFVAFPIAAASGSSIRATSTSTSGTGAGRDLRA
ncbi:MAG: hypothetical protein R3E41_03665 [Burkholderiaceae bacterium]